MATNFAKASYSEVYDLRTDTQFPTIVGIHTPRSTNPYIMLKGFFHQFKKYKYSGCSVAFIPVATLPADPLQVSYEAGEPTIDPRDLVNPVLIKGCHGESMGSVLNSVMTMANYRGPTIDVSNDESGSMSTLESLYYQLLSDSSWGKSHVQNGFRRSFYPLVHKMVANKPFGNVLDPSQMEDFNVGGNPVLTVAPPTSTDKYPQSPGFNNVPVGNVGLGTYSMTAPEFFTNGVQRLGWMDTCVQFGPSSASGFNVLGRQQFVQALPKLFMGLFVLPPAYKTEMYFRVVIKHFFEFKDFRSAPDTLVPIDTADGDIYIPPENIQPAPSTLQTSDTGTMEVVNGTAEVTSDGVL
uniref:Capsid protein n=1 Tax=Smacoviridae sp. TaxID=2715094 RepID=A0A6M3YP49_9VIRU|nr:MAG: capsid protein [Smacoviridae sp.]